MLLCCLRCALKPSASATSAFSKLYQHFRVRGHPCGLQDTLSTLRPSCSPCLHDSAMDARLATGGWLLLTRQGLSPCQRRQAFLGAITLALSCCRKRERRRSGRCRQSAAAVCSAWRSLARPGQARTWDSLSLGVPMPPGHWGRVPHDSTLPPRAPRTSRPYSPGHRMTTWTTSSPLSWAIPAP
jgi:hypothetical protein